MKKHQQSADRVMEALNEQTRKHPDRFVAQELEEYLLYLRSPLRMMWTNLYAGIFRGLGALLGASVVVAILLWILTLTQSFPLIGEYMQTLHGHFIDFIEEARYSDDFQRVEILLQDIADNVELQTPQSDSREDLPDSD